MECAPRHASSRNRLLTQHQHKLPVRQVLEPAENLTLTLLRCQALLVPLDVILHTG